MRGKMLAAAFGVLLLSGCGGDEPAVNAAPEENMTNMVTGGNDAAAVVEMSDGTRRLTFSRALAAADIKCDGVVKAVPVDPVNGAPTWRAECKNSTSHMLSVTPDGTVNIVSRTDVAR